MTLGDTSSETFSGCAVSYIIEYVEYNKLVFFINSQMTFDRIRYALRNVSRTFQREGFMPALNLLGHDAFRFLTQYIFNYEHCYLYNHTLEERDESKFQPKIRNFTFHIISSNKEANLLAKHGEDFREYIYGARQALDKGAIAFCVFVGGEFAHIGWVALTEEAKRTFDVIPYRVDFANKEACTGGTLTLPNFGGKGLMKYCYFKRFQFLQENGIKISRNAVKANNSISRRVHAKFNPRIYGEVRFVRLLKWKFLYKIKNELHN